MEGIILAEEKVFKDPVHKYIYVQDQTIWDLINSREFQRLRRIRQLGTSYLTFHGAEHSRFSHSLGVYEITRKIISQFERYGYEDWPKEERLLCLCAALLHDIGHGPFSHSIEKTFETNHEDWSVRMVLENTEVNAILRRVDEDFPMKVAGVINKTYSKEIVISLISSQLDADRMDYLLRDAYFTGVHYGTFDLERILRVVRPFKGRIVVKESGMHAIEDYLMSRYQMYWQVYFHPVTRSAEILLAKILQRAKVLYEEAYHFGFIVHPIECLLANRLTLEGYVQLDEALMQALFMQWQLEKDVILADLCSRFMNRRLFKYAAYEEVEPELLEQIRAYMDHIGLPADYYLQVDYPSDLPYDVYLPGKSDEKLPIVLLNSRDELTEISQQSEIVRSITGMHRGEHKLYYPEEILLNNTLPPHIRQLLTQKN
ncbi:HD domain-containing protein [Paenibacillus psychroresistens]|uniref:HD domain-containing protein n=1 Tax=Paenibacillus psychroresistens TaxID=1778678 RepID=A0A6B8RAT4_9BACL|nr:HD domain-containing protein [Paenibacillus psychroresistens]QGQ93669.1 HD domain-containing protein [Paenibacillus psychroresistens]